MMDDQKANQQNLPKNGFLRAKQGLRDIGFKDQKLVSFGRGTNRECNTPSREGAQYM